MLQYSPTLLYCIAPQIICALRHFFHPLAFCLCFGLLLIKVMQLRSLVSVGLGGTIPQVERGTERHRARGAISIAKPVEARFVR